MFIIKMKFFLNLVLRLNIKVFDNQCFILITELYDF
jgi:hypothetical protein